MPDARPRRAALVLAIVMAGAVAACGDAASGGVPRAEDRLARGYIRALHDSGVAPVLGRTKRETVTVPAFVAGLDVMRLLLPKGPIDTVHLERYEVLEATERPGTTRLVYGVRGGGQAAEVEVWVEREGDRPVVEEIRISRRGG